MKQSQCFEELLVAIDIAGQLQGDDMLGNANPQKFSPDWARSIEEAGVLYASNLDQLGMSAGYAILEGKAFPDGPHHILLGCGGGQDIDAAHSPLPQTPLVDLGIRVLPSKEFIVTFQEVGLTVDEAICFIELVWNSRAPRKAKSWTAACIETAVVNVNVQAQNLAANAVLLAPGDSQEIDGIIRCSARQFAALGCHAACGIFSQGVSPRQEVGLGGGGGEMVTAAGGNVPPTQRLQCEMKVEKNTGVYVEVRGVGEAGTILGAMSVGFTA